MNKPIILIGPSRTSLFPEAPRGGPNCVILTEFPTEKDFDEDSHGRTIAVLRTLDTNEGRKVARVLNPNATLEEQH